MSQSIGWDGPDFALPDEILSVMPTDPFDQLDLARKITSMAIASRVSNLEAEVATMRAKLSDKERIISGLEDKLSSLEQANREADSRLKIVVDENMKLTKERDSLATTAKKLSRDFAKLETFKRQLIQSLSDDHASQTETVDIGTCDQSVPGGYTNKGENANGYSVHHSSNGSTDMGKRVDEAPGLASRFSITPYMSPWLTPSGTPKITSTAGSPQNHSAAGSPTKTSGATSPTNLHYQSRNTLSSWYSSSQRSSAANSPPRGRPLPARSTSRIDGKEFFRQARSRLSYEQFSAFLANIKELNAHKQTREETLRKAEEIFGNDSKDLYLSFQSLLSRSTR